MASEFSPAAPFRAVEPKVPLVVVVPERQSGPPIRLPSQWPSLAVSDCWAWTCARTVAARILLIANRSLTVAEAAMDVLQASDASQAHTATGSA